MRRFLLAWVIFASFQVHGRTLLPGELVYVGTAPVPSFLKNRRDALDAAYGPILVRTDGMAEPSGTTVIQEDLQEIISDGYCIWYLQRSGRATKVVSSISQVWTNVRRMGRMGRMTEAS